MLKRYHDTRGGVCITAYKGGHIAFAYSIGYYFRRKSSMPLHFIIARGDKLAYSRLSMLGSVSEVSEIREPGEPLSLKTFYKLVKNINSSMIVSSSVECRVLIFTGANHGLLLTTISSFKGTYTLGLESIDRFTVPSKALKLLSPLLDLIAVHWPEQRKLYPSAIVVGPVYEPAQYEPRDEGYILVTAGTMGYKELFDAVAELGLRDVVLQTGRVDPRPYTSKRPGWIVFRFTSDFHRWLAGASLVVTQFPGTTAATAALAYGKPVVLVPNPNIRLAASLSDVKYYAKRLNAVVVPRPHPKMLAKALEMARLIIPMRYRNGGEVIAEIINKIIMTSKW